MKFLNYLIIVGILTAVGCSTIQPTGLGNTKLHSRNFSTLDSLMKVEKRPVAVFLKAPWCHYCKNMEQTTFREQTIIQMLNQQYYFVSFDGESRQAITFRGKTFGYRPSGRNTGTHELATAIGTVDGQLAYPTLTILNTEFEIIFQYPAFLTAKELQTVLVQGSQPR